MKIKQWLRVQVLLVLLMLTASANAAQPHLISESYWVDETGTATYQEAVNAPFQPHQGSLTKGYKPFALWLKLRISGQDDLQPLALIVKPAFLRRIELYDPYFNDGDEPPIPLLSGRDAHIDPSNHIGLDNGFLIRPSREPRDVFLRITTTTTLTADVDVRSTEDADYGSHVTAGTLSIYFAFLLAFLLWALVSWAVRRDHIYGLFSLRLLISICHIFVWFGLFRYFFSDTLSAAVRDHVYNVVTVFLVAIAAIFDFKLISEFGVPRWLQKIAWSVLGLSVLCLMLLLLGKSQSALHLNSVTANIVMTMSVMLALSARDKESNPYGRIAILTLRLGFLLMAFVVVIPVLMFQSVFNTSVPFIKVLFLHAVISTIILFAILSIRARQKDIMAQQSLVRYEVNQRELQRESELRVEKERFLSMLTHELRNPLSVIRLMAGESSPAGKAVQKAAVEMTSIIERVEQSEKLDSAEVQKHKVEVDLSSILRDLAASHSAAKRLDFNSPGEVIVETDEGLFRSIVGNLLDNADKYSPEQSRIEVSLLATSVDGRGGFELSVMNEVGEAGVPDADKLFTKYYRSKSAHRRPGSGLGLFLVASWAKALNGKISYAEIEGHSGERRVSFSLWIPG